MFIARPWVEASAKSYPFFSGWSQGQLLARQSSKLLSVIANIVCISQGWFLIRIIWQLVRIELWGHYEERRLDKRDAILAILAFPLLTRVFTHALGIQNVRGVIELVLLLFLVLKSFESRCVIRNDVDVVGGVQKPNRKIWEVFFCNQRINVSHYSTPASAATRKYNLSGIVKFMLTF